MYIHNKNFYTKKDSDKLIIDSLFKPGGTLTEKQSKNLILEAIMKHYNVSYLQAKFSKSYSSKYIRS